MSVPPPGPAAPLNSTGRVGSWAWLGDGVWRASSTLTYPNGAAAVLVPLALVVLARLVDTPGSLGLALAATGLLAGLGATMSRAGTLALAVGLVVLAALRGVRGTARAALGPCAGAMVALVCLVPSMPAALDRRRSSSCPHPVRAISFASPVSGPSRSRSATS